MFKISRKIRIWLGWLILLTPSTTMIFWETYFGLLSDGKPKKSVSIILLIGVISGAIFWFSADYLPPPFSWILRKIKIGGKRTL